MITPSFKTILNLNCECLINLLFKFHLNFKSLSMFYSAFILQNMYFILQFSIEAPF
jgi:hypothetical protein